MLELPVEEPVELELSVEFTLPELFVLLLLEGVVLLLEALMLVSDEGVLAVLDELLVPEVLVSVVLRSRRISESVFERVVRLQPVEPSPSATATRVAAMVAFTRCVFI